MGETNDRKLSGADVRAERSRHKISQGELAAELGWYKPVMPSIENDRVPLTQEAYRQLLEAISRIAARREGPKRASATGPSPGPPRRRRGRGDLAQGAQSVPATDTARTRRG
jgi:ribosome-binding protein aMBF1 (putative translation factor)